MSFRLHYLEQLRGSAIEITRSGPQDLQEAADRDLEVYVSLEDFRMCKI
jgi:hypothetical protein